MSKQIDFTNPNLFFSNEDDLRQGLIDFYNWAYVHNVDFRNNLGSKLDKEELVKWKPREIEKLINDGAGNNHFWFFTYGNFEDNKLVPNIKYHGYSDYQYQQYVAEQAICKKIEI